MKFLEIVQKIVRAVQNLLPWSRNPQASQEPVEEIITDIPIESAEEIPAVTAVEPSPPIQHILNSNNDFAEPHIDNTEYPRQKLEVLLFMAREALSIKELAKYAQISELEAESILLELRSIFSAEEHGITIIKIDDKYQFATKAKYAKTLEKYVNAPIEVSLSAAAMETMAIIAYRQPITRLEIEAIRGVNSDGIVKSLLDKEMIEEIGHSDSIGHPALYGTTPQFLKHFGLSSLKDLPEEPKALMGKNNEIQEILNKFKYYSPVEAENE